MQEQDHAGLVQDIVLFDQNYIPALELTRYGSGEAVNAAMQQLQTHWRQFHSRYYTFELDDPYWRSDFDFVTLMIAEAADIVRSGGNLLEAHRALAGVRKVFMQIRLRNRIDYFLDYLTAFHEPMEAIVRAATDKTPESITITDVDDMRIALPEALRLWERVCRQQPDTELFALDTERLIHLQTYIRQENDALEQLQHTLQGLGEQVDEASIIRAALSIRPPFVRLMMLFGDFGPCGGTPEIA
jgi:flagellar biosynthesis chaperone FliJ